MYFFLPLRAAGFSLLFRNTSFHMHTALCYHSNGQFSKGPELPVKIFEQLCMEEIIASVFSQYFFPLNSSVL